jgi:hypothetical protein
MGTGNLKYFRGKVANVIGYQSYGKQRLRSMPGRVHQTLATKQSGRLFGKASGIAAAIRHQTTNIIPFPSDLKMQTRLTSSVYKWLKENSGKAAVVASHLPFIEGYQFTDEGYTLAERMRLPIEIIHPVQGLLQIHIPTFIPSKSIIAPAETVSVKFQFAVVNCPLDDPEKASGHSTELNFDFNDQQTDEQTISLELPTQPETVLITVLSLRYLIPTYKGLQPSTAKGFMPTAIVSAMSL